MLRPAFKKPRQWFNKTKCSTCKIKPFAVKFYNINQPRERVSFRQSVLQGAASGKGLYFPENIPVISPSRLAEMEKMDLPQLAAHLLYEFVREDFSFESFEELCQRAFNFPIPLKEIDPRLYTLELFHGPSLAFKDIGARFLSQTLQKFSGSFNREITVLVATSGDTGSAVAQSFFNVEGIRVVLLYPSGKVSDLQEKTLTTVGGNVEALEVDGAFDDCQQLVKQAFADQELTSRLVLTSANSINVGRFLPQMVYYFWALFQLPRDKRNRVVFSVPSGNYGNLSAGLMAWKMGLSAARFVASSNINRVFPDYLDTGRYQPRDPVSTLSNAMDVGNPSNFVRIAELFNHDHQAIRRLVSYYVGDDPQIRQTIRQVAEEKDYILDPHGAVGYLGCQNQLQPGETGVFLETAHPAKFQNTVETSIHNKLPLPEYLDRMLKKQKQATQMPADYPSFKAWLLDRLDQP